MEDLHKKAFSGLIFFIISLGTLLFIPAWTFNYWQAWVFLGVFSTSVLAITLYLMKKDPELLARRMNAGSRAEKEKIQKRIQSLSSIAFILLFLLSALDHRFKWSSLPLYLTIGGDILVGLGLLVIFFVFKENSFTSAIIKIHPDQKVISTGPYALVRHPMYMGALVMILGLPLALDSLWGLLTIIPFILLMAWRLLEEEKFLVKNLPGYSGYQNKVKYHLVPFIW